MLERLFPRQVDKGFTGLRPALWLLGALIAVRLVMSVNSIVNTETVAARADGIPLGSYGPEAAREVLLLFALMALGHLALTLVALAVLIRWRALVPFVYLVLLGEAVARRAIAQGHAAPGARMTDIAWFVNYGLLALLVLGLALSLLPARRERRRSPDLEDSR
ncbi:MAG TPA: hypothetical protein VF547_05240 [Allosphingosinicella sp.]|jgi:hypothetical protein